MHDETVAILRRARMPPFQPPSPPAPPLRERKAAGSLLIGLAGAAALAFLALTGTTDRFLLLSVGLLLAAAGVALAATEGRKRPRSRPADGAEGPLVMAAGKEGLPFAAVVEAHPEPLVVVSAVEPDDLAGRRVVYANAAARDVLRISREGALLLAAVRNPEVLEALDESLFGRVAGAAEFEVTGAQERSWRAWTTPLPSSGSTRLALLSLRDQTDARRNERMSADFLANASHELRTPLASLTGFVETLRGHAKHDEAVRDRFLAIMSDQAARMARLIEDLLSLSRIELNEHVPPRGSADLALIVSDVVDGLVLQARRRDVRFDLRLPPRGVAVVRGDRDQILQVAQNLLDNALKYSPPGGAVVAEVSEGLSAEQCAAGRGNGGSRLSLLTPDHSVARRYALLRVTDSGPGLAREHLPRLTERFYRVEGQKSGDRSGTGLGLAIVKHVLNRHSGGLTVESRTGEGASFTAYFPMAAEAQPAPPPEGLAPADKKAS